MKTTKLYQVLKNANGINEIDAVEITENTYKTEHSSFRSKLSTKYHETFDNKEDAEAYHIHLLKSKISSAMNTVEYYQKQLADFIKKK